MSRTWGSITRYRDRGWRARGGDDDRTTVGIFFDAAHGGSDGANEEAERELAAAHRAWRKQHSPKGRGITVIDYGRKVLDRWEIAGTRRGIDRDRDRFERHIARSPFAGDPVASLEHRQVQRWVREIAASVAEGPRGDGVRKRSRRTVLAALNLLRSILRAAIEEEIIDESPARSVIVPRGTTTAEEFLLLEPHEVDLVLAARPSPRLSIAQLSAITVAVFSGLRPGELWGLRWGDVIGIGMPGAARPEIVVRHSRANATKGGRVRRVPLLYPARAGLVDWWAAQPREPAPADLVWPNPDGGIYADGFDAGWANRRQCSRAQVRWTQLGVRWQIGIARRIPFKDLRHTCASALLRGWWVDRGWIGRALSLVEIAQWLGHQSVTTTERHYAKLAPGGLLDVVPTQPPITGSA